MTDGVSRAVLAWTALLLLAPTPYLAAQLAPTDQLVVWAAPTSGSAGSLRAVGARADCLLRAPTTLCSTVLGRAAHPLAGGAAYDPRHDAVWVTDGRTLELRGVTDCLARVRVALSPVRAGATVSGLALDQGRRELYVLETALGYAGLRRLDVSRLPPRALGTASATLSAGRVSAGIAYDGRRDRLYLAAHASNCPQGCALRLLATRPRAFGSFTCSQTLRTCHPFGSPILGAAFDPCRDEVSLLESGRVLVYRLAASGCFTYVGCCGSLGGNGLAFAPGWRRRSVGASCSPPPCEVCSLRRAEVVGAPVLGNAAFTARLRFTSPRHPAFLLLAAGACGAGLRTGVVCGPLYPDLRAPHVVLSGGTPTGPGPCNATAGVGLPIPLQPALCGRSLCMQWVWPCGSPRGLAASNGLEVRIGGG